MEYVIVAFRSRAQTVKFYQSLASNGVTSEIVNTPKEAGVGCGLSVKISSLQLVYVKQAVKMANLNSFAGFFLVKVISGKRFVRTI